MKKLPTIAMTVLIGIVALLLPLPAQANRLAKMAQELGLTEKQQTQIQKIYYESRRSMVMLKANLQIARMDLRFLIDKPRPNLQKVMLAVDKLGKLEIERKKKRISMMIRVKLILTPKQAVRWTELRSQRRGRRRFRRRRHRKHRRHRRQGRREGRPPMVPSPPQPPTR